jgi:hypothetical protein
MRVAEWVFPADVPTPKFPNQPPRGHEHRVRFATRPFVPPYSIIVAVTIGCLRTRHLRITLLRLDRILRSSSRTPVTSASNSMSDV